MNTITTDTLYGMLQQLDYNPSLVEPLLRHGMWVAKVGHWKQQRHLLRPLPSREELARFVRAVRPINVWTTGEGGNIATAFREVATRNFNHLIPPPNLLTHESSSGQPELDITNEDHVTLWLDSASPDVVVHAAAVVGSERVEANTEEAVAVNVDATATLFRLCMDRGIKVIFVSSTCVYDPNGEQPYIEDMDINPQTLYGQTKREGEHLLQATMDLGTWMVVRPCYTYGRQYDRQSQLARFARATFYGEKDIRITLDPDNEKDWMRVENTALALDVAIRALVYHPHPPLIMNIGLGEPRRVIQWFGDLAHHLAELTTNLTPHVVWEKDSDYMGSHVVSSDLLRSWGWSPMYQGRRGYVKGLSKFVREMAAGPTLTTDFTALRG